MEKSKTEKSEKAVRAPRAPRRRRARYVKTPMDSRYGQPVTTSVRIPAGLLAALRELSKQRGTSLNAELNYAVIERLSAEGLAP